MLYIDQLRTPFFPIGLVKNESGFIVRSAVISVNACTFFWLSQTLPVTLRTELGSSDQQASPSAGKNTGVPTATYVGVDISEVPGCHLIR